jgi:hypothetical protein
LASSDGSTRTDETELWGDRKRPESLPDNPADSVSLASSVGLMRTDDTELLGDSPKFQTLERSSDEVPFPDLMKSDKSWFSSRHVSASKASSMPNSLIWSRFDETV